jgi:hypothetical protein
MKKNACKNGLPALDLLEEAAHELRRTPAKLWLAYYAGTIPFVLGLLYFWADMRFDARAARHCGGLALGVTALFVWMKCWQTVFVSGLRERLAGRTPQKWSGARAGRVLLTQAAIQPSKLLLLPLAALTFLPLAWTLAFYESVTVCGNGDEPAALRELMQRAGRLAKLWPLQNVVLVLVLGLLGVMLWLNAMVAVVALPWLLKMLLGVETVFTQGGYHSFLNSTFLTATLALAGLVLDPLIKMVYTLRGFYGEARQDGADLLAELAGVRRTAGFLAAAVIWLALTMGTPAVAVAQAPPAAVTVPAASPAPSTTPAALDRALKATLAGDKYTWRLPREKAHDPADPRAGWLQAFFQSLGNTLRQWAGAVRDWIEKVVDWFNKVFKQSPPSPDSALKAGGSWMAWLRGMALVLLALSAGALGVLLWRYGRQAWSRQEVVTAEVLPAQPDLADENVMASQLPEDEWLKLARELAAQGDLRRAMRALYLASLAHLAARELVSIARFKTNRDYQIEVARRARPQPELRRAFDENAAVFDRVWYGLYTLSAEAYAQFQANLERIRAC